MTRQKVKSLSKNTKQLKLYRNQPVLVYQPEYKSGLYRLVYQALIGKVSAFVLLSMFLLQATYVYGQESSPGDLTDTHPAIIDEIGPPESPVYPVPTLPPPETDLPIDEEVTPPIPPDLELATSSPPVSASTTLPGFDLTPPAVDQPATSTIETIAPSSSEDLIDEDPSLGDLVSVVESSDSLSFNRNECTEVSSGSFYCYELTENILADNLFAATDEDGDLEIFLIRQGQQAQLTKNRVDDASPYYDEVANRIVWHRLIDERFQIIDYDIETGTEYQITNSKENNMEPTRGGEFIAWQRWSDTGWQVVLYDGVEESVVSKSSGHNLGPNINGELLIWTNQAPTGEKRLEVYNLNSGDYVTLDDPDGLAVYNPRLMLVYDAVQPSGDLVTRGYDIASQQFVDIDTEPRPLPDDIPDSEPTGETRAIVQPKPTVKGDTGEIDVPFDGSVGSSSEPATPYDLDLRDQLLPIANPLPGDEIEDLIIAPYPAATSSMIDFDLTVQESAIRP